jgi:2-C-methyl-D-erythritol 4-phosphate cytidylyltransferase
MPRHFAIVPAAGSGSRFGSEKPKQYLSLLGRPLLHHTLAALAACPEIDRVWVVLARDDREWDRYDWSELGPKLEALRCGGATRAESVGNGLRAAAMVAGDDDWILVHDAARPCLSQEMLAALLAELADDEVGGILAVPVADTLKRADGGQRIVATEARDDLWQAQTPQMFRYGVLREGLEKCSAVTDEAGAIEGLGLKPRLVRADATNLKVTYPADLVLAALILRGRK